MNLDPRQASRVIRTVHQVLVAGLVAFLPFVALLDLPADKVAQATVVLVGLAGAVARFYNRLWPADEPLDESPLD